MVKKRLRQKLLSSVLSAAMIVSMLPSSLLGGIAQVQAAGDTHSFDATTLTASEICAEAVEKGSYDKAPITAATQFDEFFTVRGSVLVRTKTPSNKLSGDTATDEENAVTSIEIQKADSGQIEFVVPETKKADVTIVVSSTGGSNTSDLALRKGTEGAEYVKADGEEGATVTKFTGTSKTTVEFKDVADGTYQFMSPGATTEGTDTEKTNGRGYRVYTIDVTLADASESGGESGAVAVESVTIKEGDKEVVEGKTITLVAEVKPDDATDQTVTWESSDTAVATVAGGVVTGVKAGTAKITAKAGEKVSEAYEVTVTAKPDDGFTDGFAAEAAEKGKSYFFDFTKMEKNASGAAYTWDGNVAAGLFSYTASKGRFHGTQYGIEMQKDAALTFKVAGDSIIVFNKCKYSAGSLAASVEAGAVTPEKQSTVGASGDGATEGFESAVKTQGDDTVSFVYLGEAGNVTFTLDDKAYIYYVAIIPYDESTAVKATGVTISGDKEVVVGNTITLSATVEPANTTIKTVAWESSDATIATVDSNGVVTGVKEGTAKITAKCGDATSEAFEITVASDGFEDGLAAEKAEAGKKYWFNFKNEAYKADTYDWKTSATAGLLSVKGAGKAYWHSTNYGIEFNDGDVISIKVAGSSVIVFNQDNNSKGNIKAAGVAGVIADPDKQTTVGAAYATAADVKAQGDNTISFKYAGGAGEVLFTLVDGKAYIHDIAVIPDEDDSWSNFTSATSYDFSDNGSKTQPEALDTVIDGTNGIILHAGTNTKVFDPNQFRFRNGVEIYIPVKDDTTKVVYAQKCTATNPGRPTYVGGKDSEYVLEMVKGYTSVVIDDITDLVQTVDGKRYLPVLSGGDIKITEITVAEFNPVNTVTVSGTVTGAAAAGVEEISFTNLDNDKAEPVTVKIDAEGKYTAELRRVAGNTNYAASVSKVGYKIDNKDKADRFTLTGNDATATQNFTIAEAPVANISGTISGIEAVKGDLAVSFKDPDAIGAVKVELTKKDDGTYTYTAAVEAGIAYDVIFTNADDYEAEGFTAEKGESTINITAKLKKQVEVSGKFVTSDKQKAAVTKITFKNMDTPEYTYTFDVTGDSYTAKLRAGEYETSVEAEGYEAYDHVVVADEKVANDVYLQGAVDESAVDYQESLEVGKGKTFETIREAIAYVSRMTRENGERVTLTLTDELYREQVIINTPNVTIKSALEKGSTITWYYGVGFSYYSAKPAPTGSNQGSYYDEAYAVDKYEKTAVSQNPGHWGATVNLFSGATGFQAENIAFENSLNRYMTEEEIADGADQNVAPAITARTTENIDVKTKAAKERACVIYIQADDTEYKNCQFLSSQDTIYTGDADENSYFVNCVIEGNTDYICGDGNPVFDNCVLGMVAYSDQDASGSIIVANKAKATHGYLFNGCQIVASDSVTEKKTVNTILARAWAAGTVYFLNTEVASADMIDAVAYKDMNEKVVDCNYNEYNTHDKDGNALDVSKRPEKGVTILTEEQANAIVLTDWFDGWKPEYYEGTYPETVVDKFEDVKDGDWFVKAVQFVYDNGIMAGKGEAKFAPNDNMTRAEFARMLYNHADKPAVTAENKYTDVEADQWYTNAIVWAKEKDIASGNPNGTFGVNDNITREQLALMLYKYAKASGKDVSNVTETAIDAYGDADKADSWAKTALNWAVTNKIMSGKGSGDDLSTYKLDPLGQATRAECASMMSKLVQMQ